jgi:hypothetical protein
MSAVILFLACLFLLFLYLNNRNKERKKKVLEELQTNWGKAKEDHSFNFNLIGRYFQNRIKQDTGYFQVISDKVSEDLLLHDIFEQLDRTVSRIGQQFLYYKLRVVQNDVEKLLSFDRLAEYFVEHKELREKYQLILTDLAADDAYYLQQLLHDDPLEPPTWYPMVYVVTFAVLLLGILAFVFPVLVLFIFPLYLFNMMIHYWNKRNINYYLIALSQLNKAYKVATRLKEIKAEGANFQSTDFLQELTPLKKKMQWVSLNNNFENDSTTIFYTLFELLKMTFNLEILFFFTVIREIKTKARALDALFGFIGEMDAALSTASFRTGLSVYCKPTFGKPKQLHIADMKHPLVEDCIPNELDLHQKSLLLTGSNMSGKTTFIRSVGINMLLAQTIYTCTARRFEAPFSKIYTSIKITDNLLTEKSYYFEEVSTIKVFIDSSLSSEPALFVLDEIFKGTNTVERISGGKAILSFLTKGNHLVLVSTHDIELTELLKNQFDLYHFSESVKNTQLVFDYKIKQGPLTTRNAIKIMEMNQYPKEIIEEANNIVNLLENDLE